MATKGSKCVFCGKVVSEPCQVKNENCSNYKTVKGLWQFLKTRFLSRL